MGYLQDSRSIENPLKRSLARRISKELAEAGLSFADMGFSVGDSIPRVDTSRYKIYGGSWSANLDGNKTSITMRSVPGQVGFDVNLGGTFSLSASGAARPFGFIRVGWRHVDISGNGNFQLKLSLVLDSSFVGDGENAYAILGQEISTTGSNPLSGDMHLSMDIDVGTTSDILTGAIVEEFLEAKVKPTIIKMMKESLQAGLAVKNNELRSRLPVYYRIPSLHESIAQIADDSRRTELQGRIQELLKKPLIGNIVEQRFQELAFYVLTDNRDALMKMACDFTQSLHAGMAQPKLYTDALGSCGIADLTGNRRLSAKFFTDASCTTEVPFKRTTYASYCSELLDGTIPDELLLTLTTESAFQRRPNTQLGNAAAWTPDSDQPNNPLPSVPSQAWSLAHGTQFAITTEPLTGKTIPFVKRIRYRETLKKIPDRSAIYRGCLVAGTDDYIGTCSLWGYGNYDVLNPNYSRQLAGYVSLLKEPGSAAMHYGCVDAYLGSEGDNRCLKWGIRENSELSSSFRRDFVGYINPTAKTDIFPVFENCSNGIGDSEGGFLCTEWKVSHASDAYYPSNFVGNLYKSDQAACQLEMRVYKKDLSANNLKPLLAFHGGSWNSRGVAFIGLESQIAHYTEQGFVVFVPFYRLSGQTDGNFECNGAKWSDVVADAEASLDWVKINAIKFGADSNIPIVMGQSAGAHLAGWLMTYRPEEVSGGLLLYPPADLKDLLVKYRSGYFSGTAVDIERTMKIVSDFIGTDVKLLSADDSAVLRNSFANQISYSSESVPPVFMLHGVSDELVPVSQSITMCNAYGGSASEMPDEPRSIFTCGDSGSLLHLVQQGEHGMDNCLMDLGGPCLAGDSSSRHLAADSLRQAREWLKQPQTRNGNNAYAHSFGKCGSGW